MSISQQTPMEQQHSSAFTANDSLPCTIMQQTARPSNRTALHAELLDRRSRSAESSTNSNDAGHGRSDGPRMVDEHHNSTSGYILSVHPTKSRCLSVGSSLASSDATLVDNASLYNALQHQDWQQARLCVREHPEMANYERFPRGWYPLHLACFMGSCPLDIVESIVKAYPEAVDFRTNFATYRCTPLHLQARNCQRTSSKMRALLQYDPDVTLPNRMGHSVLHTACGNNADISVLRLLVDTDRILLELGDNQGEVPLLALWKSLLQTIPGQLAVAEILSQDDLDNNNDEFEPSGSFQRFWDKVRLLALRQYGFEDPELDLFNVLGHALVKIGAPIKMLNVALRFESLTTSMDWEGNYLLHKVAASSEYTALLEQVAHRDMLVKRNNAGKTALLIALGEGNEEAAEKLLDMAPALGEICDLTMMLYPFQYAAMNDCCVHMIYRLLCAKPDLLRYESTNRLTL